MIKREKVVRLPIVLFGQFDEDYLDENINDDILEGRLIPIPSDLPIHKTNYGVISRYGFNKTGVLVASVIMLLFGMIEFLANGVLLAFKSNVTHILGGCACAVFLTTTGIVGITSSCTLEDCPIGTTMVFATLTTLTSAGQFGLSVLGIMVDFLGLTSLGITEVTNTIGATAMHGLNGLAAIVGGICAIIVAARTCSTVCCSSRRFEYREFAVRKTPKIKQALRRKSDKVALAPNYEEIDSTGYGYRSAWPSQHQVLAMSDKDTKRKKDIIDLLLGEKTNKVDTVTKV